MDDFPLLFLDVPIHLTESGEKNSEIIDKRKDECVYIQFS